MSIIYAGERPNDSGWNLVGDLAQVAAKTLPGMFKKPEVQELPGAKNFANPEAMVPAVTPVTHNPAAPVPLGGGMGGLGDFGDLGDYKIPSLTVADMMLPYFGGFGPRF